MRAARGPAHDQPIATAVATSDLATDFGNPHAIRFTESIMNVVKPLLSSALVLLSCVSAQAAYACDSVTPVERRIVERSGGEIESLRSFVGMTSIVYGINMFDVRDHLDQWRAAVDCHNQVAAAERATRLAAQEQATRAETTRVAQR